MTPAFMRSIKIGFQILDRGSTAIDPDFRAPTGAPAYLPAIEVDGLVKYERKNLFNQKPGGNEPMADGRVMIWQDNLTAAGIAPTKGDKIVSIAGETVHWMIVEVRTQVHSGGQPNAKLFYFQNKVGQ